MSRGGRRNGAAGKAYGNRTDLNGPRKVMAIPGQPYGAQAQQVASQQAVPMGTPELPGGQPTMPGLGELIAATPSLMDPTQRPNEPITAGLPSGPGPGPDALMSQHTESPEVTELRALYARFPYPGLAEALARLGAR